MASAATTATEEFRSFLKEVGQRITKTRTELGLSQYQLADLAHLTQQQVSYAERGDRGLRCDNLLSIAKALNVSTDYLLTGQVSDKELNNMLSEIQYGIDELDAEQCAVISELVKLFIKGNKNNPSTSP